jgi:hypothetical protein
MAIQIFHFEGTVGGDERTLELGDDGTLICDVSPNYYAAMNGGKGKVVRLSVVEGKKRWPQFAKDIDRAVAELRAREAN